MTTWKMITGTVQVLGMTLKVATRKELRVGDEILTAGGYPMTPTEGKRVTEAKRMTLDVTLTSVTAVDRKRKLVYLGGRAEPLDVSRTGPCLIRPRYPSLPNR